MKKMYIVMYAVMCAVVMSGCGEEGSSSSVSNSAVSSDVSQTDKNSHVDNQPTISASITLDDVLNHATTDISAFEYGEENGGIEIYKCTSDDEIIVIPEEINGKAVISIDRSAFNDVKGTVRGLYIADTISELDYNSILCNYEKLEILVIGGLTDIKGALIVNDEALRIVQFNSEIIGEAGMERLVFANTPSMEQVRFLGDIEEIGPGFLNFYDDVTFYAPAGSNIEKYIEEENVEHVFFEPIE